MPVVNLRSTKAGKLGKSILLALLTGGVITVTLSSPAGVRKLASTIGYELKRREQRKRFFWTLAYLRRRHYLDYRQEADGTLRIEFAEDGQRRALRYKLDTLQLPRKTEWDGKWRMIAFDIPEEKKRGREALREKMRELGCIQLQKSLWVWPYDCRDEIDFIAEVFDVGPYVHYIVAESVTSEKFLRYRFHLA